MALRLVSDFCNPNFQCHHGSLTKWTMWTAQVTINRLYPTIMQIRPFLAGQAFEPELIQQMSLALETVCAKLAVALVDDPATRLVASKIIELAQRGVRDTPTLIAMTLKEFKHY